MGAALLATPVLAQGPHRHLPRQVMRLPTPEIDSIPNARFIPQQVDAFLNDPRIDPQTRGYLRMMARKPTEDWTLAEYEQLTALVPTLTEMYIATAKISEFYEFLGLDPVNLFNPSLGADWQQSSTALDPRIAFARRQAGECAKITGFGNNIDPATVTLKELRRCLNDEDG